MLESPGEDWGLAELLYCWARDHCAVHIMTHLEHID
jgi:hypothetical protein